MAMVSMMCPAVLAVYIFNEFDFKFKAGKYIVEYLIFVVLVNIVSIYITYLYGDGDVRLIAFVNLDHTVKYISTAVIVAIVLAVMARLLVFLHNNKRG